jgi:hypothetical protein
VLGNKNWSKLTELSSSALRSSKVNIDDQVELIYGFPTSENLYMSDVKVNFANSFFNAQTAVNSAADFISIPNNIFLDGDRIKYSVSTGNTVLTNLTNNSIYYVVGSNSTGIQLSNTYLGTSINLAAGSNEGGHNFTAVRLRTISVPDTTNIANDTFVYLESDDEAKTFNVRQVVYVANSTSVVLNRPPTFNTSNAKIGIIPEIETASSAFLYDQNHNIIRYVTGNDVVYERYLQFSIKIVPLADSSAVVPRVSDMRALALQV